MEGYLADLTLFEELMYCTVRIETEYSDGDSGVGTGFFFKFTFDEKRSIPMIVTNKHVVHNETVGFATVGRFFVTVANDDGTPRVGDFRRVELAEFGSRWLFHLDDSIDLCALPVAPLVKNAEEQGVQLFWRDFSAELVARQDRLSQLSPGEEVLMVGYPVGLWDQANNFPVFRKGIAATHPGYRYNGKDEFLIDAACFPGSSGSPVLIANQGSYATRDGITMGTRIMFLGVLYAGPVYTAEGEIKVVTIPTQRTPTAVTDIPMHLGYVIRAERILDFEKVLRGLDGRR